MAVLSRRTALVGGASGLVSMGFLPAANADVLRVHGSTTFARQLMEPYQQLIELAAGHQVTIIANKSSNGLFDLLEGRADIAMISAPLADELIAIRRKKPALDPATLRSTLISQIRVAFAIHPANPVRKVSLKDIAGVLQGRVKTWSELGGPDLAIRPVYVKTGGGVTNVVLAQVLDGKPIEAANAIPVETAMQVVKVVSQERGALALTQNKLAKDLRLTELDVGAQVFQELSLVTLGPPSPAAQALIRAARDIAEKKFAMAN